MSFTDLTTCHCITCGIEFAMPSALYNHQQKFGGSHTCPNGHSQGWDKNGCENANLRRERDRLAQQIAQRDDEIREKERALISAKGQMTKLRKRVARGVCPCCTRSFQNLARHMATKHPDEVKLECVS